MATQTEIREKITARIIESLSSGKLPPWRKPWSDAENAGHVANVVSKKSYSGINPLILSIASEERGYQSRWWGTFRQWQSLGVRIKSRPANIKSGHFGTKIVFVQAGREDRGRERQRRRSDLRNAEHGSSFSASSASSMPSSARAKGSRNTWQSRGPRYSFENYDPAENAIAATGADIRHGGSRAFYQPAGDYIQMPVKNAFAKPVDYYSTLAHETLHWTGHEKRLNRLKKNARFGDASYAFEELVAEIGGCFFCSEVGVPQSDDLSNHHAYLGHWLTILKGNSSAILSASSQASAAVDHILGFSRPERSEDGEAVEPEAAGVAG